MANLIINILYVLLGLVVMVSLDYLLFKLQFKEHFWKLLVLNIGIFLVFLAFYYIFNLGNL
jgi:hypothetical protein